jgi:hypothetical protein
MTRTVPRGAAAPPHPPAATWEKGVAQVGLSLGRQNLDHNSTSFVINLNVILLFGENLGN